MSPRAVILFAALGIAWGIPYLLIKVAVTELDPAVVVFGRSALGGLVLLPLALARKQVLPVLRRWRPLLAYTVVEIVLPWYFLSSAEQRLPSSTAGLLLAAVPLVGVFVAFLFGRPERFSLGNWAGVLLGMLGVAALVGLDVEGGAVRAVVLVGIVVVCYATAPLVVSRWLADVPSTGVTAAALGITALAYAPVGSRGLEVPSGRVVVAVLVLAGACTVAALLMFFALIAEAGPQRALVITYVNPAVALALGMALLDEPLTLGAVVGFPLVLAGCVLATRRSAAGAPVAEEALAEPVARS